MWDKGIYLAAPSEELLELSWQFYTWLRFVRKNWARLTFMVVVT